MKSKQLMLFAVAICCGLVAMIGAQQILSGNKPVEQEMVRILVAKADIGPGVPLNESNVGFKNWPKDNVLDGVILSKEEFAERTLKIRVSPNMPILAQYLGPKGADGIRSQIPEGKVLATVLVDSTAQAHSGLLRPGAYVEITCAITRTSRDGRNGETTTIKTVLNRVKVAAVNERIDGSDVAKEATSSKTETISFLMRPRQAKLLTLAKEVSKNRLQFHMLGEASANGDDDTEDLTEADLAARSSDLMGEKSNNAKEDPLAALDAEQTDRPHGSNFAEFLKQQPITPAVVELGSHPSKPTWRIEIFSSDNKKTVQLHELDEELAPPMPSAQLPATSETWTAPLMRFFTRKRLPKTDAEQNLSPTVDEASTGTRNEKSASASDDLNRR